MSSDFDRLQKIINQVYAKNFNCLFQKSAKMIWYFHEKKLQIRRIRIREKHVMNSLIVFIRLKKDHGTTLSETSPPKLMNKFIKLLKSVILMLLSFPEFTLGNVWLNLVIPKKEADGSVLNQLENYYNNISHDYPLI